MAQASVSISINGWNEDLKVSTLTLQQAYNKHHVFELLAFVPAGHILTIEELKTILGEQIQIFISTDEEQHGDGHFTGFVDQVIPIWTYRSTTLRIKGYSPTVFMDSTPRFRSFTNKSVKHVMDKVMKNYTGIHRPKLTSNSTGDQIPFTVQTQETDYKYLCRVADEFGKMFYYDGQQLHYGDLNGNNNENIALSFKEDCNQIELSMNLAPLGFKLSGFELEKSEILQYNAAQEFSNSNPIVAAAMDKCSHYPSQGIHLNHLVNNIAQLKSTARKITARQAHELVLMKGVSNNPALKIGSLIRINETNEFMGNGSYIIIEVNHIVTNDSAYQNSFTAVPAGFPFPIRMQQSRNPICGPLMAIVKENNDPKNLGRVKVEFIGDEEKSLSPWLRVLVPYTKHGGMFFLPEKGDQVLLFFEDFNVGKSPFVMGCFYHGNANAEKWKDGDNKKKGFAMDKIKFLFDDRTGKLTIEAEEIELKAKKEMNLDGGHHLTQKATRIDLNP